MPINIIIVREAEEIRNIMTDNAQILADLRAVACVQSHVRDKIADALHHFFKHQRRIMPLGQVFALEIRLQISEHKRLAVKRNTICSFHIVQQVMCDRGMGHRIHRHQLLLCVVYIVARSPPKKKRYFEEVFVNKLL